MPRNLSWAEQEIKETYHGNGNRKAHAAAHHVAHRALHHAVVLHRLHRPGQHRLCRVDDEGRPRLYRFDAGFRRRHILLGLLPVRSPVQHHPAQGRCADVDCPRDGHVGHYFRLHGVRRRAGQFLRDALPAGRRRSGLLPRHHSLSQLLVPGPPPRRRHGLLHGGRTAVHRARFTVVGRIAGNGWHLGHARLAMDVHPGGDPGRHPWRGGVLLHDRQAGKSQMAERR